MRLNEQAGLQAMSASAMSSDGVAQTRGGFWSAWTALAASSTTLVCCALPALLVAIGAGAALSSLVSVFPQLVWLSENKAWVFGAAGLALSISGALQWQSRHAPCPVDPHLRRACQRTRRNAQVVWAVSMVLYLLGGWFAFLAPLLQD